MQEVSEHHAHVTEQPPIDLVALRDHIDRINQRNDASSSQEVQPLRLDQKDVLEAIFMNESSYPKPEEQNGGEDDANNNVKNNEQSEKGEDPDEPPSCSPTVCTDSLIVALDTFVQAHPGLILITPKTNPGPNQDRADDNVAEAEQNAETDAQAEKNTAHVPLTLERLWTDRAIMFTLLDKRCGEQLYQLAHRRFPTKFTNEVLIVCARFCQVQSRIEWILDLPENDDLSTNDVARLLREATATANLQFIETLSGRVSNEEWEAAVFSLSPDHANVLDVAKSWYHEDVWRFYVHRLDPTIKYRPDTSIPLMIRNGQYTFAKQALKMGEDNVNMPDKDGFYPLHTAVMTRNFVVTTSLLRQLHASPNVADVEGTTPLFIAVRGNDLEMAKLLLAHGARPDVADRSKRNLMHFVNGIVDPDAQNAMVRALAGKHPARLAPLLSQMDVAGNLPEAYRPSQPENREFILENMKALIHTAIQNNTCGHIDDNVKAMIRNEPELLALVANQPDF